MHILIASQYLPWPLMDGGRVAQYRTFEALRNACTFTLVVPVYNVAEEADAKIFAEKFPNVTVETVRYFHVPSRRARLRKTAGRLLRSVFPAPKSPLPSQPSQDQDEALPSYPFGNLDPAFVRKVEEQLTKGCDIFQAEFANMLNLGPWMAGRVPSIFVHHQLHFVYARRSLETNGEHGSYARYMTEKMIREEYAYLNAFDSVIVFSDVDREALNSFCPQLEIYVSPFPSPEEPPPVAFRFEKPVRNFIFASSQHQPNVDGLRWFMKEVWREIKKSEPDAVIEVIGKWPQSAQTGLPHYEDIQFTGFVPDLSQALQNKIMIVPVWVGSGIRTKILAAWSSSCPVITTTVGVEGLPGQNGEHFMVADNAPAFASACIDLAQNLNKLNRIAANGLDLVKKHYSLAAVRKTRLNVYEMMLTKRRSLRKQ